MVQLGDAAPLHHRILVFPNPTEGWLTLSGIKGPGRLELYDMNGRKALSKRMDSLERIDVNFLNDGLYIGVFNSEDTRYHFKLIKE